MRRRAHTLQRYTRKAQERNQIALQERIQLDSERSVNKEEIRCIDRGGLR